MPGTSPEPIPRHARGTFVVTLLLLMLTAVVSGCGGSHEDQRFSRLEPELIAPTDGETFQKLPPRNVVLEWRKVPGAKRYVVEVELQNPVTGVWMPTHVSTNRQITTLEKAYIEFPGDQPGRWRVVALNAGGTRSRTSEWFRFEFVAP